MFAFVASAGGSIGLLAGGVLTHAINWHWIFFINVPIGVAAIALGIVLVEENEGAGLRQGVDVLGSVLITAAMMLGVYTIVETDSYGWGSPRTLGLGAVALAMIGAFLAYEGRIRNPIMPLRVLRSRSLTGANLVRGFLVIGMFSSFFLGALYLEHVLGYSSIDTGLAFLPMTLSIGVLSVGVTPRLLSPLRRQEDADPGPGDGPRRPPHLRPRPDPRRLLDRTLPRLPADRPRRRHLLHAADHAGDVRGAEARRRPRLGPGQRLPADGRGGRRRGARHPRREPDQRTARRRALHPPTR